MKLTDIFWRWLSCLLTVSFVLSLLQLHLYTGYPKVWDTVQVGMDHFPGARNLRSTNK